MTPASIRADNLAALRRVVREASGIMRALGSVGTFAENFEPLDSPASLSLAAEHLEELMYRTTQLQARLISGLTMVRVLAPDLAPRSGEGADVIPLRVKL